VSSHHRQMLKAPETFNEMFHEVTLAYREWKRGITHTIIVIPACLLRCSEFRVGEADVEP
jgi:hypothetical protein